jgi:hypothetical protein
MSKLQAGRRYHDRLTMNVTLSLLLFFDINRSFGSLFCAVLYASFQAAVLATTTT